MTKEENKVEGPQEESKETLIPWSTFLEEYPVGTWQNVSGYATRQPGDRQIKVPWLRLYCEVCDGVRNFNGDIEWGTHPDDKPMASILVYVEDVPVVVEK